MEKVCRFCGRRFTSADQYYTDHLGDYCRDGKACIEHEESLTPAPDQRIYYQFPCAQMRIRMTLYVLDNNGNAQIGASQVHYDIDRQKCDRCKDQTATHVLEIMLPAGTQFESVFVPFCFDCAQEVKA